MLAGSTLVSVIMPTFNQSHFISRAVVSLKQQSLKNWELIIVNDGSTDDTGQVIENFLSDSRIRYFEHRENRGLGAALNTGLDLATADLIAYLPSDDIYYEQHLYDLSRLLCGSPENILAFSGMRHHYNRETSGRIESHSFQLVQVMHRKTLERWIERTELVTDNLDTLYWSTLEKYGSFISTGRVSCEWVDHPQQHHKIIREPIGGINPYKLYYRVNHPLRFHSSVGNFIDEPSYYRRLSRAESNGVATYKLKILLVGELAYNPERILALEEQGHTLYGLWMRDPYWYNYVGPLPFGQVKDIPYDRWEETLAEIKPDVIYALLNWQAVPFAHEILLKNPGIPFVWHFKEGPFICLEKGTWDELIDLYTKSDGQIYSSPEMRDWFRQFLPFNGNDFVLDGDLPKKDWFTNERLPLLSATDGEIHTVVPGRPIGLHPQTVQSLGAHKIHVHFYGDFTHGQWKEWINKTKSLAPEYLHIHSHCSQENWVREFSQYDAGWLHFFKSENNGELMRANWDDLNYPARITTLAAAGLPLLQRDNSGHMVATQNLVKQHGLGIFFNSIEELAAQLRDEKKLKKVREQVWQKRFMFTFDEHVDDLIKFFQKVIDYKLHAIRYPGILPLEVELGDTAATAPHEQGVQKV
jgi:glycosyltransferase involved in cell wall biosynthesis